MLIEKIKDYLDGKKVKYIAISHSPAFSAQEIAALVHIPGRDVAKTVIVNINGKMAMAVLPANYRIHFNRLMDALGTGDMYLAAEEEFNDLFPDCEVGAMPPFGNLYGLEVFVAKSLTEDDEIVFNGGTHTDLIKMSYKDFEKLVKPKILSFTTRLEYAS